MSISLPAVATEAQYKALDAQERALYRQYSDIKQTEDPLINKLKSAFEDAQRSLTATQTQLETYKSLKPTQVPVIEGALSRWQTVVQQAEKALRDAEASRKSTGIYNEFKRVGEEKIAIGARLWGRPLSIPNAPYSASNNEILSRSKLPTDDPRYVDISQYQHLFKEDQAVVVITVPDPSHSVDSKKDY